MSRRRSTADDRLAQRAVAALRIAAAEEVRASKSTLPADPQTSVTTYRIGARVTVTYDTRKDVYTGTVVNAWPAGGGMTYAVRPLGNPDHPGYTATAEQMTPADEQHDTEGGAR